MRGSRQAGSLQNRTEVGIGLLRVEANEFAVIEAAEREVELSDKAEDRGDLRDESLHVGDHALRSVFGVLAQRTFAPAIVLYAELRCLVEGEPVGAGRADQPSVVRRVVEQPLLYRKPLLQ